MEDHLKIKAYYESQIEQLKAKPKLSIQEIEELAELIADDIDLAYSWKERYDVAFNKIHERYG